MTSARQLTWLAALFVLGVLLVFLGQTLGSNVIYFQTPSEATAGPERATGRLRLAGAVVPGSVAHTATGVTFELTDGITVVQVRHDGEPPELFADGAPIVCEGRWDGDRFHSDRLMIKHGSEYRPPEVLDAAESASLTAGRTATADVGTGR